MAANNLTGKRVAILATDGVEQEELTRPREALNAAGAKTSVVSPRKGEIKAWQHTQWGDAIPVDVPGSITVCGVGCGGPMRDGLVSPLNIPAWHALEPA